MPVVQYYREKGIVHEVRSPLYSFNPGRTVPLTSLFAVRSRRSPQRARRRRCTSKSDRRSTRFCHRQRLLKTSTEWEFLSRDVWREMRGARALCNGLFTLFFHLLGVEGVQSWREEVHVIFPCVQSHSPVDRVNDSLRWPSAASYAGLSASRSFSSRTTFATLSRWLNDRMSSLKWRA